MPSTDAVIDRLLALPGPQAVVSVRWIEDWWRPGSTPNVRAWEDDLRIADFLPAGTDLERVSISLNGEPLPAGLDDLRIEPKIERPDSGLGQEAFLELMVAQLKNQDPMNPMESGEFLGQIAQFGTVNGITELQNSFALLASSLQSSQALQASTMVGRNVLVTADGARLNSGEAIVGAVELAQPVGALTVSIFDAAGQLLRRIGLGAQSAGLARFTWDGLDEAGSAVPEGDYRVTAEANVDGETVSLGTLIQARVESVTLLPGADPRLNLTDLGSVALADVKQVM